VVLNKFDYNNITLVGRIVSALLDSGIIFLVYKITHKIFNEKTAILAALLYSISVLPIQLAHFFAVDTFLAFFLALAFYLMTCLIIKPKPFIALVLGISFGLSIASKISALLFMPIIVLGFIITTFRKFRVFIFLFFVLIFMISSFLTLRLGDPHLFQNRNIISPILSQKFISNIKELKTWDTPKVFFPPAVQWINTTPLIFPLKNIILWGLGLPLGILSILGFFSAFWEISKSIKSKELIKHPILFIKRYSTNNYLIALMLAWVLMMFIYQGIQFSKTMRYFYPIYPFLAIFAANFSYKVIFSKSKSYLLITAYFLLLIIWPLSFIQIYSHPHSRVTASEWMYKNIPPGSTITCEYWDDCLPLSLGSRNSSIYNIESLTLFDPDSNAKWTKINAQIARADYVIMSSNRLWGSIPMVPERYPVTSKFYSNLFAEKLNFVKVAEFSSYPTVPILNIPIPDDSAEEAFTVYDHPKVIIFISSPTSVEKF
jgi:hypothetical protein